MALNEKHKGIIATVIFHTALILLLVFLGFTTPLPLPGEEGVEVNLGASEQGIGKIQPIKPKTVEKVVPPPPQPINKNEKIVTQDTEEAPAIVNPEKDKTKNNKNTKVTKKSVEKKPEQEKPKINPAALYKGKQKNQDKQTGEGITGKPGDQGKPSGSKDSQKYEGQGGEGNGLSFSLKGRQPKFLPKPSEHFSEEGTVVVQIFVDKWGKVVKAVDIDKGSNTTNLTLRSLARKAAMKAVFNANPNAPELQKGTITYHFIIKS